MDTFYMRFPTDESRYLLDNYSSTSSYNRLMKLCMISDFGDT